MSCSTQQIDAWNIFVTSSEFNFIGFSYSTIGWNIAKPFYFYIYVDTDWHTDRHWLEYCQTFLCLYLHKHILTYKHTDRQRDDKTRWMKWGSEQYKTVMICELNSTGRVVSGYRVRDRAWAEIGRRDPRTPQVRTKSKI